MTPEIYIFHLRTDGLYSPNLIIHELPVAHLQNKHLVASCNCFRSYLSSESASPNRKKVPNWWKTWMTPEITFFICGRMAYICRTYLFMNYQLHPEKKKQLPNAVTLSMYKYYLFKKNSLPPTHPKNKNSYQML